MKAVFVTGTDTDAGKTYITTLLLKQFNQQGYKTFGIKPIASGCKKSESGNLVNDDALSLQAASSISKPYQFINPLKREEPVAPYLATDEKNIILSTQQLSQTILSLLQKNADINIIEGVGGWSAPLNSKELITDAICQLEIPTILVVGMRLGCLNHSILSSQAIINAKVPFVGWVANCLEPNMLKLEENILTLKEWIPAPCLGRVSYNSAENLDIQTIFSKASYPLKKKTFHSHLEDAT